MSKGNYSPHESSIAHMDANLISVLTYILPIIATYLPGIWRLAFLIPLLIFFIEKESNLVKFHAIQSLTLYLIKIMGMRILLFIPLIGSLASFILGIIFILLALYAAMGAFNYEETTLPFIGDFITQLIK